MSWEAQHHCFRFVYPDPGCSRQVVWQPHQMKKRLHPFLQREYSPHDQDQPAPDPTVLFLLAKTQIDLNQADHTQAQQVQADHAQAGSTPDHTDQNLTALH